MMKLSHLSGLLLVIPGILISQATIATGQELLSKREIWTADQLYEDFLAEFGQDMMSCYPDYQLAEGPSLPDGPEEAGGVGWIKAIVAIDASGSMAGQAAGELKMDAAKAAVRAFLESVPEEAEIGLLAFGHRGNNEESGKAESCKGIELVSDLGAADGDGIVTALESFEATGWTPLAAAISKAGESFTPGSGEGEQVVFVVSDGRETCGGDPVAAAQELRNSDVKAIVNIIGFDVPNSDRKALKAVADAGGGVFSQANDAAELREQLRVFSTNLRESSDYVSGASVVASNNHSIATNAKSDAHSCIANAIADEYTKFARLSGNMVIEGLTDRDSADEAKARLKERHAEIEAELEAFRARVDEDLKAVNEPIEQNLEHVKEAYGDE